MDMSKKEQPIRVILMGLGLAGSNETDILRVRAQIEPYGQIVAEDFTGRADMSTVDADLAIVFGGDGSILSASHQMGKKQLPVAAVNRGRLGFLADISLEELSQVVQDFAAGKLSVVEHLMLQCELIRGGEVIHTSRGLNETSIQTGSPFAMLAVELTVDGHTVTTYHCDGLIISTPVGSTAHALSAGGPILTKDLQAFVVVPVSPHTLTNRPVVDSADRVFELRFISRGRGESASAIVDGQVIAELEPDDYVRVQRAQERFRLITAPGHCYYHTLREKLDWGGRLSAIDGS